ncbi:hypothetical protein BDN70DRAFT_871713 [Pholiota conissans]|uniref:NADH dehydrogenase [ubiquinone] 1 alpha subcomplex subunit n=1 Tax=Pholiota conissans TaxID=109636 RepID=A0A9P5ZB84_9AGAR|nr:hypothetical protein BDN70DRAFT_871713 [Pholiota conissans]
MSFLKRIWNVVRHPIRYVGRDLEGNTFYETRSLNDSAITKRTVQYSNPEDVWKYIGGGKRLPIQWSAWLTHTRLHPPTLEELSADMVRQQRVRANVALIEARDRAEAEQVRAMRQLDAQLALEDAAQAAAGGGRFVTEPSDATPSSSESGTVDATSSSPDSETIPTQVSQSSDAESTKTTQKEMIKVLPPTFLTPSTPRKTKSSTPFRLPNFEELDRAVVEEQARAGLNKDTEKNSAAASTPTPAPAPPSPWRSKAVPETESWTPKARSRG